MPTIPIFSLIVRCHIPQYDRCNDHYLHTLNVLVIGAIPISNSADNDRVDDHILDNKYDRNEDRIGTKGHIINAKKEKGRCNTECHVSILIIVRY